MNKLLSANVVRLFKSKLFWISAGLMFLLGIWIQVKEYIQQKKYGYEHVGWPAGAFFAYAFLGCILIAVFCGMFVGTEYSDGTMRNKMIVGHKRAAIYAANFMICVLAGALITISYIVPALCTGAILYGEIGMGARELVVRMFGIWWTTTSVASLGVLISMLSQSKAVTAVLCSVGVCALLFAGMYVQSRLSEPEVYDSYMMMGENGEFVSMPAEPNPSYLRGVWRDIYEFFLDFLPGGQLIQLTGGTGDHVWVLYLYSTLIIGVSTGIGIGCFQRKDIK